jgi:inositol transport system substrate-binding protein
MFYFQVTVTRHKSTNGSWEERQATLCLTLFTRSVKKSDAANDYAFFGAFPALQQVPPDTVIQEPKMKKFLLAASMAALMSTSAMAGTKIGVSMAVFDDNFLTVLRNGIDAQGKEMGAEVQIEDAGNDVAKQLDQIKNFAASGVQAIIVNPVDTSATQAMSDAAAAANIPLVYVNRQPINVDTMPDNQAFVASNEVDSGTLETKEVCRLLKAAGKTEANIYVMMGELSNQAAVQRTKDIHDVMAGPDCGVKLNIIDEQTANWSRDQAQTMMTNWISAGKPYDAVIANNDEMAIGAIQSLKAAGVDMKTMIVGGVDATQDALAAMQAGDLDATVFQDAAGQGKGALEAAIALAGGKAVEQKVYIPFQLVTPENIGNFLKKN